MACNIWCLGLFAWLFKAAERKERIEMLTVLAFATPMELFFSEIWLIYEYQRGLMPLFVPVGHWFLFDAGRRLSSYLPADKAMLSLFPFVPLVAYGVWTGGDTSAILASLSFGFHQMGATASTLRNNGLGSPLHGVMGYIPGKLDMGE